MVSLPLVAGAQGRDDIVLATTTSVRDAGLLQHLLPRFERISGTTVRVLAVGSGQAMALGRRGEADVLILHDPQGEEDFVAEGYGVEREALMHSHFVLLGPPSDPAVIRQAVTAAAALASIASSRALFLSRGDRSGTHVKERGLWRAADVEPDPEWHWESGQGMGATLQIADELGAYTIVDIGTYLAHKSPLALEIFIEDDPALFNPYHIVVANPERFAWVNVEAARALSRFLRSPEIQQAIGEFGRGAYGRPLFVPDDAGTTDEHGVSRRMTGDLNRQRSSASIR